MSEWKEVWYLWDKKTPITGDSGAIRCNSDGHVVSYTRREKRRRCTKCNDGLFCYEGMGCVICPTCNGTGWEYKK